MVLPLLVVKELRVLRPRPELFNPFMCYPNLRKYFCWYYSKSTVHTGYVLLY